MLWHELRRDFGGSILHSRYRDTTVFDVVHDLVDTAGVVPVAVGVVLTSWNISQALSATASVIHCETCAAVVEGSMVAPVSRTAHLGGVAVVHRYREQWGG